MHLISGSLDWLPQQRPNLCDMAEHHEAFYVFCSLILVFIDSCQFWLSFLYNSKSSFEGTAYVSIFSTCSRKLFLFLYDDLYSFILFYVIESTRRL